MTSRVATNYVFDDQGEVNYLRVNRDGQPLQGQVPLTYQYYSGNGNETIDYDGSDILVIDSTVSAGPLTIRFFPMNNNLGRSVQLVAFRQVTNNVVFDFGTGEFYVPPLTSPLNSTTLRSPTAAILTFFDVDKAVILANPTVFPSNIIPGGPGQVLTTNAGTGVVDWEDPQSGIPKCLTFKWSTGDNDLNQNTPNQVQWTIDTGRNDTSLTLDNGAGPGLCGQFVVTRESVYSISVKNFIVSSPSIAYRYFIGINHEVFAFGESSLGLTGQDATSSLQMRLNVDDVIAFYVGNAAGTVTPVAPADVNYGTISIVEY